MQQASVASQTTHLIHHLMSDTSNFPPSAILRSHIDLYCLKHRTTRPRMIQTPVRRPPPRHACTRAPMVRARKRERLEGFQLKQHGPFACTNTAKNFTA